MSTSKEKLFSDFNALSVEEWQKKIVSELKGKTLEELTHNDRDGIATAPFYAYDASAHRNQFIWKQHHSEGWHMTETICVAHAEQANKRALQALNRGANTLWFKGHIHGHDFPRLLKDIALAYVTVFISPSHADPNLASELTDFLNKHEQSSVNTFICYSPLSQAATKGEHPGAVKEAIASLYNQPHTKWAIDTALWRNAGCTPATELALFAAEAANYLNSLTKTDEREALAGKIIWLSGVGEQFFTEIAKLRAARIIWANLCKAFQINQPLHIQAENLLINKSALDRHNNLLRATTEGMSAILGGADGLYLLPFDATNANTSELGLRMSRNIQHILKEEAFFDKIEDPSNGAYYIDQLSKSLASKAWDNFQSIEAEGGYLKALTQNSLQQKCAEQYEALKQDFLSNKKIILGVNQFPNDEEVPELSTLPLPTSPIKHGPDFNAIQPVRLATEKEMEKQQTV